MFEFGCLGGCFVSSFARFSGEAGSTLSLEDIIVTAPLVFPAEIFAVTKRPKEGSGPGEPLGLEFLLAMASSMFSKFFFKVVAREGLLRPPLFGFPRHELGK